MAKVLFVSYDGMTDPLGQSQVLAYMEGLSQLGHTIHILSYEKPEASPAIHEVVKQRMHIAGITWHSLTYTKKPPILSTMYDLYKGWQLAEKIQKTEKFKIVHCRMLLTAIIGLKMQSTFGTKVIFDMRGWWVDEKLESGLWNSFVYIPVYRFLKFLEKRSFKLAEVTVSLTQAGKREIEKQIGQLKNDVPVIPTCVNFKFFPPFSNTVRNQIRAQLGITTEAKVLIYSGSIGANYNLSTLFKIYQGLQKANSQWQLLVLSNTDAAHIMAEAKNYSIDPTNVFVKAVEYPKVSSYLMAGDAGLIFYKPAFSLIGRCPTKMAEYLATGLPVLSIKGIGDVDFLLQKFPESGCLLTNVDTDNYNAVIDQLLAFGVNKEKLRTYAVEYFDVNKGIESYNRVYQQLVLQ